MKIKMISIFALVCVALLAEVVVAIPEAVVDISQSKVFDRGVLGQPLYFAKETPQLLNRTATRSVSVGTWSHKFNWKNGALLGLDGEVVKSLDYQISDRDNHSESFFQVNMRGITDGAGNYIDQTQSTMSDLAADWVQYTNFILQRYRQGDTLAAGDASIINEIKWTPKLLTASSANTAKVENWIIGNEEELDSHWTGATFAARYKAITFAMRAIDSSIKVGPGIDMVEPANTSHIVRALFQDSTAKIDAVYYHSYPNIGQYYEPNTLAPTYVAKLASMQAALRGIYDSQKARRDAISATLTADGRAANQVAIICDEWNMMGWTYTATYNTMVEALSTAEAVFTFADIDMPASMFWADTRSRFDGIKTMWPVGLFYKAMIEYAGNMLVDRYVSTGNNNVRLYTTKDSQTGRVVLWALNFDNIANETLTVSLQNIGSVGKKTLMRLGTVNDSQTTLFTANNEGDGLDNVLTVDWRNAEVTNDVQYANLANFNLYVPKASIVALVLEPAGGSSDVCGDVNSKYLEGDVDHDCNVDFADFAFMAQAWQLQL